MKRNSEIKWRIQYSEKGVDKREEGTLSFLDEIHMTKRFDNAIIESVEASFSITPEEGDRFFLNGYQTWTHSREKDGK